MHMKTLMRFPQGFSDVTVMEDLHEIYGLNHSGLRLFLAPFCRSKRIEMGGTFEESKVRVLHPALKSDHLECQGASEGYVECLVSGNVFLFGSEHLIQKRQEGSEILADLDENEESFKCVGGTCILSFGNPSDAFVTRDQFN